MKQTDKIIINKNIAGRPKAERLIADREKYQKDEKYIVLIILKK